jgi:hypothetical protein
MVPPKSRVLRSGRTLRVTALEAPPPASRSRGPFVALLPAFDVSERERSEILASLLLQLGCIEICCVGRDAELLHDTLDGMLEERGALDVVTTWHAGEAEAVEYFLFAAGGGAATLLALTAEHPALTTLLNSQAEVA